jgi:hypothetical protein
MKSEWRLFGGLALFLFVAAAVYSWWTGHDPTTGHRTDWIGATALILAGLLCLMCGGFFWFVSRRIDPRPEDREDGEIQEGAGEIGFFSPGSYWPFGIAVAAVIAGLGIAYWQMWLLGIGLIAVVMAASGLLFEYFTGTRREH